MRNYDKYRNTKFIQKSDVERGALVTIDKVTEENVAPDSQAEEIKYVINFKEAYKPWAPGVETLETISHIAGTGNVDEWSGTKLVLFVDQNVSFQGRITGGIRCRAPKSQPETQPANEPHPDITEDTNTIEKSEMYKDVKAHQESKYCPHCGHPHQDCICNPPF